MTVCLTQDFSDQFVLLILWAITMAVVSQFLGCLFSKNMEEAKWYMTLAGAAGGAVTTLMVPFFLSTWYGDDYGMMWVLWTVIANVVVAYYVHYDLTEYQGEAYIEQDDYIYAMLHVYIDWAFIVFYAFLACCWNRMTTSNE